MPAEFRELFASLWVLALLTIFLAGPFAVIWIALSIRRDLHRIANSFEKLERSATGPEPSLLPNKTEAWQPQARRVSNSAFGR